MNKPNILIAMADDLAWPHLSAYGCRFISTPNSDRIAMEGILFSNCYTTAPTCTASRGSFLTGRYPWQLEEGCQLYSLLPKKFPVYPDLLEEAGYFVGLTRKGWGPGSIEASGRTRNPAGPSYDRKTCKPLTSCMRENDYAANFEDFLNDKSDDRPFCFWYGSKEPHRPYEKGSGLKHGKRLEDVEVPGYLPDCDEVRSDFLDYALEVERFDSDLGKMMDLLKDRGELDNTIIIVTGDNGFPFPRAKATVYQNGCHVPLAVRWGNNCPPGRTVTDFISFVDFAPTLLEIAGLDSNAYGFSGKNFLDVIQSDQSGRVDPERSYAVSGRERHGYNRPENVGNPTRSLVTDDYLYIHNFIPGRSIVDADKSPTKTLILESKDKPELDKYYKLCFGSRPEEELYAASDGPDCIENRADDPEYSAILESMRNRLHALLKEQGDPRMYRKGWVFDCYPYYGRPANVKPDWPKIDQDHYQLRHIPEGEKKPEVNAADDYEVWS